MPFNTKTKAFVSKDTDPQPSAGQPRVVVAFYGLEYTAKQVVGEAGSITTLTQPGADPHGLELKPSQVGQIGDADLVAYLQHFQPEVDKAVEQSGNTHVLNVADTIDLLPATGTDHDHEHGDEESHEHGDEDPHYWLDPKHMAKVGQALADQLGKRYPELNEQFQANAKSFTAEMNQLDQEYASGLNDCERKEFITAHQAFNYLAHSYGLTEIGISGINPDGEPSPARIAQVQAMAKEHGVTTIFFETLTSPAMSEAIAGDLGLKTAVLDPLEGITDNSPGDDYPSVMRANLEALKEANGCQ